MEGRRKEGKEVGKDKGGREGEREGRKKRKRKGRTEREKEGPIGREEGSKVGGRKGRMEGEREERKKELEEMCFHFSLCKLTERTTGSSGPPTLEYLRITGGLIVFKLD
jgi:hypothetical protein